MTCGATVSEILCGEGDVRDGAGERQTGKTERTEKNKFKRDSDMMEEGVKR